MTTTYLKLTEAEFDDQYELVPNHLNPEASWQPAHGQGCLFETYGEELAFVRRQDPHTVWTLVDGADDDATYLLSGFHLVNRIGYLISRSPVPEGTDIEVRIPSLAEEESPEEGGRP